jgi:hypothetical protein
MNVPWQYSRVNGVPAAAARGRARLGYSRANSRPPKPRPTGAPSPHEAPDRRGFVVYGAVETVTNRRSAVTVLPK